MQLLRPYGLMLFVAAGAGLFLLAMLAPRPQAARRIGAA
jgi:hypothetical protein